jgi:PAS domain S-box-containing protein
VYEVKDEEKTEDQLVNELLELRQRVAELEASEKERKRAEDALRKSEERYRTLFESLPVGLFRSTPDGRFLDANPAHVQLLGCPDLDTLLATPVADFYMEPEERQQWKAVAEHEGVERAWEVQWRRLDGTPIWVREHARAVWDAEGRVVHYDGIVEDITERKRAEEALRESEGKLGSILSSMVDFVFAFDTEGRFTFCQAPSFGELLYLSPDEFIGRRHSEVIPIA